MSEPTHEERNGGPGESVLASGSPRELRPWRPGASGPAARALGALLAPAGALYGAIAAQRLGVAPAVPPPRPTIGVGSPVAGGAGKTPTALALVRAARAMGLRPGVLSRGHGGRLRGPVLVDPARHGSADVGDEPRLLAAEAPTVVGADRVAGARRLAPLCDLILMDDGFQSRRLDADLWLLIVDGAAGVGNGRCLPAGPLRAPLSVQLDAAGALVAVDSGAGLAGAGSVLAAARARGLAVHRTTIAPVGSWSGREVAAFCGLGDPAKFRRTLEGAGARIAAWRAFPDHHVFSAADLRAIEAMAGGLPLVTTAKDAARLGPNAPPHEVLGIELRFDDGAAEGLIERALERYGERAAANAAAASL